MGSDADAQLHPGGSPTRTGDSGPASRRHSAKQGRVLHMPVAHSPGGVRDWTGQPWNHGRPP
eukprot:1719647-Pyramimonas_sp.AAC.1